MTDPVRLTERELDQMRVIAAQARELAEAQELIEDLVVDSSRCTCRWCERARAWLAATAQEESDTARAHIECDDSSFCAGYNMGHSDGRTGNPEDPDLALAQYQEALAALAQETEGGEG